MLDITIAYELIYPQTVEIFSTDDLYYAESMFLALFRGGILDLI